MIDFKRFKRMTNQNTVEVFRMEAFKELDLDDNLDTNHLFQLAWRHGYAGGYEEVFEHFKDLVDIMRENQTQYGKSKF